MRQAKCPAALLKADLVYTKAEIPSDQLFSVTSDQSKVNSDAPDDWWQLIMTDWWLIVKILQTSCFSEKMMAHVSLSRNTILSRVKNQTDNRILEAKENKYE